MGLNRDVIMGITLTDAAAFQLLGLDHVVQTYVPLAFAVVHIACDRLGPDLIRTRR